MNDNGTTTGAHREIRGPGPAKASARCPTCDSPIPRAKYERILRIDQARQKRLATERAAVERERQTVEEERASLDRQRDTIARSAAAAERIKWQASASKARTAAAREARILRKAAEAERRRLVQIHERKLQAEIRRREAKEQDLARERATMRARTRTEIEARVRAARREVEERLGRVNEDLNTKLKQEQARRQREEIDWKDRLAKLQHKADDRNAAHFGPESEEELVEVLRAEFRSDQVVHRGKKGDVLHTIDDGGKAAGVVVYECRKRRDYQRKYVRDTKQAMDAHSTKYGMLVTRFFPRGRSGLCIVDGVILVTPEIAVAAAAIVREGIVAISRMRLSEQGKEKKAMALFEYLRGEEFSNAVALVTAKVAELRESLGRERSLHDGWWRSREHCYAAIVRAASGIHARVREVLGGPPDGHGSNGRKA